MAPSAQGVRAGRAFVELYGVPEKLYRVLDAAKLRVITFAKGVAKIGVGAAGLGGAVLTPIAKFFTDAVNEGADVQNLANRFNTTAEAISRLKGAFAIAGVGAEQFETTLDSLAAHITSAADEREALIRGFQETRGDLLLGKGLQQQLEIIFNALNRISDPMDRIVQAQRLGLGSPLFLEAIKKGSAGLRDLENAGIAAGTAMSSEDAKDAKTIYDEFNKTIIAVKSTLLAIGKALLPTGKDFASVGQDIREALTTAREWIAANKQTVVVITAVAAALVTGGAAMVAMAAGAVAVLPAVAAIASTFVSLIALGPTIAAVLGAVFSPVGAVVAGVVVAVAALTAGIVYLVSRIQSVRDAFGSVFSFLAESFKGIKDAIGAGDWTLAFEIGVATIDVAWKRFILGIQTAWTNFKAFFVDGWRDAVSGLKLAFVDFGAWVARNITGVVKEIAEAFNSIAPKNLQIDTSKIANPKQINENRDRLKKEIMDERARKQAEAEKFRGEGLAKATDAFTRAVSELEALKQKAAQQAQKHDREERRGGRLEADFMRPPSFTQLYAAAKGIFGGPAQQQLGYADQLGQRQLEAQQGIQNGMGQAVGLLDEINKKAAVWT